MSQNQNKKMYRRNRRETIRHYRGFCDYINKKEFHYAPAVCMARNKEGFMIIDQRKTNAVIQALCLRGLQGKSQKLFVDSSLPEVDLDNLQRQIADLKNELDIFSRDIAEIEQDYKDGKYEQENC